MLKKPGKQYGLITKKKKPESKTIAPKLSFFDDDEDEEIDEKKRIEAEIKKTATQKKVNKQTQLDIQRALEQDASIYDYDGVYDDMKQEKQEKIEEKQKDRKPKYMKQLLKTAEKRQQLHERRIERKVQKERDAEGDEFADKEKFVTAAYKQKMIEIEEQEKEEKLQDLKESIMDVTKQKDMSGFYKHFLNQNARIGETKTSEQKIKESESSIADRAKQAKAEFNRKDNHLAKRFRTKRTGEEEESDSEENDDDPQPKAENVKTEISEEPNPDADSDFANSSDDDANDAVKHDPDKDIKNEGDVKVDPDNDQTVKTEKLETGQRHDETLEEFKLRLKKKKERRLDVYRRRNTEETIVEARKRYHERRNERKMSGRPI